MKKEKEKKKSGPKEPWKYPDEFVDKEAIALKEYVDGCDKETVPFECEFAPQRGYYSECLSRWAHRNERFRQALKYLKDAQEHKLVSLGLKDKVNTSMAIFALKNVSGWRDKKDITTDDKPIDAIKVEIVNGTKG